MSDSIDPAVWQRPGIRPALAARDIGAVYRHLQRLGISQRRIAALTGQSQSEISEILSGRRVTGYEVLTRICDGLEIPRGWMGLAYDGTTASILAEEPGLGAEVGSEGDMRRRMLLALGAAAIVPPGGPAVVRPRAFLPDVVGGLRTAMIPAGPARAHGETRSLADLTASVKQAWLLRQGANYGSLGGMLATLLRDVDDAAMPGAPDAEQALRLSVHAYNAASSVLRNLGSSELALLAADRAVRAGRSLDDPQLGAAAAYRLANVLLSAHRFTEAHHVALHAAGALDAGKSHTPRSLAIWGGLVLTAAVAAARNADESEAWDLLRQADNAADVLGFEHVDIYTIFGPTSVVIHRVQVAVELGDGREATQTGERVNVDGLPEILVERRAQFLIDVTRAHVVQRNFRSAVSTLLRADHLAPEEVRLNGHVQQLVQTLLKMQSPPPSNLRELADRVNVQ